MRAEDVLGLRFFATLFAGIGLILAAQRQPEASARRRSRIVAGMAVTAFALLAFGTLTTYFIRTSARPLIEGNIWGVADGRVRSSGASFKMTTDTGEVAAIRCTYDGPGLQDGERARVRYVAYNRKLLELTMLSGPFTGWHFQESSGERSSLAFALMGVACGVAAQWQNRKRAA